MLTNLSMFPLYETAGKIFSNTRVFRRLKKSQCHDNCRFSDTVISVALMSSLLALPPSHLSVLVGEDTLLAAAGAVFKQKQGILGHIVEGQARAL